MSEKIVTQSTNIEVSLLACLANAAVSQRPDVMRKCMAIIKGGKVFCIGRTQVHIRGDGES